MQCALPRREILGLLGIHEDRSQLLHTPDTRALPVSDESFDVVIANAVLEHICQPRGAHIRNIWRIVTPSGHLIVNETPNKYLPLDFHTTGLWLVPWLPRDVARRYAILRGRFSADKDWDSSGWRGIGYYELVEHLPGAVPVPVMNRGRHTILLRLGLPRQLLDPYPTSIFQKPTHSVPGTP